MCRGQEEVNAAIRAVKGILECSSTFQKGHRQEAPGMTKRVPVTCLAGWFGGYQEWPESSLRSWCWPHLVTKVVTPENHGV